MHFTLDNPADVPRPAGPYSHVARLEVGTGALLFLSGQAALDDSGKLIGEGDMTAQATAVFESIKGILESHGATFDDVVNIRTFMADMDQLAEYGAVRMKYLNGTMPTSTTVETSRLFRDGLLLEVELVAAVSTVG